jgi:GTP cyclohydrolase I
MTDDERAASLNGAAPDPATPADSTVVADPGVAERIRARLAAAGHRFHANDNICRLHRAGELGPAPGRGRGEDAPRCCEALVIDTESDHNTQDTARRVAKMYVREVFGGRYVPAPQR